MPIKERASALKHAAYSATSILPCKKAAAFAKLRQDLVNEFKPSGAMEEDVVAGSRTFSGVEIIWGRFELRWLRTNA